MSFMYRFPLHNVRIYAQIISFDVSLSKFQKKLLRKAKQLLWYRRNYTSSRMTISAASPRRGPFLMMRV